MPWFIFNPFFYSIIRRCESVWLEGGEVRRGTANIRQYPQQWPSCSCPGPAGRWKMQLEQSIAVRQTAEKEERSFAGFCGHQLQMCGGGQVEHRAAVLQCCSHTRLPTRGHRGAVFNNFRIGTLLHYFTVLLKYSFWYRTLTNIWKWSLKTNNVCNVNTKQQTNQAFRHT